LFKPGSRYDWCECTWNFEFLTPKSCYSQVTVDIRLWSCLPSTFSAAKTYTLALRCLICPFTLTPTLLHRQNLSRLGGWWQAPMNGAPVKFTSVVDRNYLFDPFVCSLMLQRCFSLVIFSKSIFYHHFCTRKIFNLLQSPCRARNLKSRLFSIMFYCSK